MRRGAPRSPTSSVATTSTSPLRLNFTALLIASVRCDRSHPWNRTRRHHARTPARPVDLDESGPFEPLNHQLRDPISSLEAHRSLAIVVDQENLDLASITRVDRAWCVDDGNPVFRRQSRSWMDQGDDSPRASASAIPVGTKARSPGPSVRSTAETKSAPASPGCAYAGIGSPASSRDSITSSSAVIASV